MLEEIVGAFLPKGLLDHFDIKKMNQGFCSTDGEKCYEIYLEEKNQLPEGYSSLEYESKGFYEPKRIQDFPIRGKALYLIIKRRRWRHKSTKEIIKSDYSFMSNGVKLTQELCDFLKGTGRDPSRYG